VNYYILEGSFREGRPEGPAFQEALKAHHAYLAGGFQSGRILFSGPKAVGGGGVIVLKCDEGETPEAFCAADPFVTSGVQEYRITGFRMFKAQPEVEGWFK